MKETNLSVSNPVNVALTKLDMEIDPGGNNNCVLYSFDFSQDQFPNSRVTWDEEHHELEIALYGTWEEEAFEELLKKLVTEKEKHIVL